MLKQRLLIGLTGKAGVGKDTAARFMTDYEGFKRYAFADPIRKIAAELYGVQPSCFETEQYKAMYDPFWSRTHRQMMQFIGTELVRENLSADHWIKLLERRLTTERVARIAVTDVRFPDELEWIVNNGGYIIHIESLTRRATSAGTTHQSEQDLDMSPALKYNRYYHIQNDGTMKQFRMNVMSIVTEILNREIYGGKYAAD